MNWPDIDIDAMGRAITNLKGPFPYIGSVIVIFILGKYVFPQTLHGIADIIRALKGNGRK